MTLDEVLEACREGKITQRELAAHAKVSQPTISNLLTGKAASTSHANALLIIAAGEALLGETPADPAEAAAND